MATYYKNSNGELEQVSKLTGIPAYSTDKYEQLDEQGLIPTGSVFALDDDEIDENMQHDIEQLSQSVDELNSKLNNVIRIVKKEINIGDVNAKTTNFYGGINLTGLIPKDAFIISVSGYFSWTDSVYAICNLINDKEFYLWYVNPKEYTAQQQICKLIIAYAQI